MPNPTGKVDSSFALDSRQSSPAESKAPVLSLVMLQSSSTRVLRCRPLCRVGEDVEVLTTMLYTGACASLSVKPRGTKGSGWSLSLFVHKVLLAVGAPAADARWYRRLLELFRRLEGIVSP